MNRKQLTIILSAVVVLGALGLWFRHQQTAGYKSAAGRMGEKVLGEFDANSVQGLHIQSGTNSLEVVRKEGKWVVEQRGGYPANFTTVADVVRKLYELKVAQPVPAGESQLTRLELNAPDAEKGAATLVELKDKDGKVLKSLLLGKKHLRKPTTPSPMGGDDGWPDGRYVMVPGELSTISLVSEPFSNVEPKPDQWLNKDFFKVEKSRRVKVTWPEATNSWEMARATATGSMTLQGFDIPAGKELDTSKASSVASALGYPSFTDVVVDPDPAETGLDQPVVITLETFDDFTYTLKVGRPKDGDDYYLTVDVTADIPKERKAAKDEKKEDKEKLDKEFKEKTDKLKEKLEKEQALAGWTYRVSKWTLDPLLKKRDELLKDKTEETSTGTDAKTSAAPASPPPTSIVPDLQPVPPPPTPQSATDIIKPTEVKPVEAPPAPEPPPAPKPDAAAGAETAPPAPSAAAAKPEEAPSAPPAAKPAEAKPAADAPAEPPPAPKPDAN